MSRTYHQGEPPSDGWWPTRVDGEHTADGQPIEQARRWDGICWSCGVDKLAANEDAIAAAAMPAPYPDFAIRWAERPSDWPTWSQS